MLDSPWEDPPGIIILSTSSSSGDYWKKFKKIYTSRWKSKNLWIFGFLKKKGNLLGRPTNEGEFPSHRRIISIENYPIPGEGKGNNCSLTRFQVPIPRIFLALSFFLRVRVWRIANWGKGWLTTVQTLVCLCWPRLVEGQLEYSFWQTFFFRLYPTAFSFF